MSRFTLTITLGDQAMRTPDHVAHALRKIACGLDGNVWPVGLTKSIHDLNGNRVGAFAVIDPPDPEED